MDSSAPSSSGRIRSPPSRPRHQLPQLALGSENPSLSTAAERPPTPPPRIRLPQLALGFGNPSLCTAANITVEDMLAQLLHVAYNDGHTKVKKMAQRLVKRSGMTVAKAVTWVHFHAPWSKGHGPLHVAAAAGKAKACRILMRDFGLDVNRGDTDAATPLVHAIYDSGSTDVVKLLLESGANPNLGYSTGVAPLHMATIRDNYEIATLLLSSKAKVDLLWEYRTPLYIAAQHGNERMMRLLLQNGAAPNVCVSYTLLKAAVLGRSMIAVELLIEAGARVNVGMPETPLIAAATAGLTDIIKCLLKAGADPNITDLNGRTPIEAAAIQGWRECVAVLFPVTNCLARVAHWSIDGIIQHAKFASSLPQAQDLPHEDDVSDFEAEGDAAFSKRDYAHALTLYHMAIEINPDATLYAKRSLCFLHTDVEDKALEDAETYKDMQQDLPEYVQGAAALDLVKEFGRACEALNLN